MKTDQTGAVAEDCKYLPFGEYNGTCSSGAGSPYHYAGYELDGETGLYHMWYRYYNPRIGRFMSADPLSGDINSPQGLNRFGYVGNNPVRFVDPLGLYGPPCSDDGLVPGPRGIGCADPGPKGRGAAGGCDIVIGFLTLHFSACPGGGGGGRERRPVHITAHGPIKETPNGMCLDRSTLPLNVDLGISALSVASKVLNETLYAGANGSGNITGGALASGGSVGYSSGIAVDPKGNVAYVLSVNGGATVGTLGITASAQIGAATYDDVSGFSSFSFGKEAGGRPGLVVGGGYNVNSSGTYTYANVGVSTPGASATIDDVSYGWVIPACK